MVGAKSARNAGTTASAAADEASALADSAAKAATDVANTTAELIAHCKSLLAGYKVPKEIRFEPIPKTSTGKIQKFQLRERARSASAIE